KDYSINSSSALLGTSVFEDSADPLWTDYSCTSPVIAGLQTFESSAVIVYPNPAENFVNINIPDSFTFEIFNSTGSLVASGKREVNQSIDVSNLERGLYIIKINDSYKS